MCDMIKRILGTCKYPYQVPSLQTSFSEISNSPWVGRKINSSL
eukprot:UN26906